MKYTETIKIIQLGANENSTVVWKLASRSIVEWHKSWGGIMFLQTKISQNPRTKTVYYATILFVSILWQYVENITIVRKEKYVLGSKIFKIFHIYASTDLQSKYLVEFRQPEDENKE